MLHRQILIGGSKRCISAKSKGDANGCCVQCDIFAWSCSAQGQ